MSSFLFFIFIVNTNNNTTANTKMAKYFKFEEFTKSATAKRLGIDNTPKDETIINNINEVMEVMDKIRIYWTKYCEDKGYKHPQIVVNSGYRCEALNKAINGAKRSAHKIGAACDFEAINGRNNELYKVTQEVLFNEGIRFDQLIDEYNMSWIHLGLKTINNEQRSQIKKIV